MAARGQDFFSPWPGDATGSRGTAVRVPAADALGDLFRRASSATGRNTSTSSAQLVFGYLPGAGESRHFLFYSALAAPAAALARPFGLDTAAAFTLLNGLLLLAAFYVAASRLHWTFCAILFAGPILWWLDKLSTEPFTFALYAIAFALLARQHRGGAWPPSERQPRRTPAMPHSSASLRRRRWPGRSLDLRDRRFWLGLAAGTALARSIRSITWWARDADTARVRR